MRFDDSIIILASGRRVHLQGLRQYWTYEGLPTAEGNRRRLDSLIAGHRDAPDPGAPRLIPPVEEPIAVDRPYPFGTPSALPAITCIGRFTSSKPARAETHDFSGLVVIWFQRDYALPIDPVALDHLRRVDWNRHAADLIR